jgi:hypothetical protein
MKGQHGVLPYIGNGSDFCAGYERMAYSVQGATIRAQGECSFTGSFADRAAVGGRNSTSPACCFGSTLDADRGGGHLRSVADLSISRYKLMLAAITAVTRNRDGQIELEAFHAVVLVQQPVGKANPR